MEVKAAYRGVFQAQVIQGDKGRERGREHGFSSAAYGKPCGSDCDGRDASATRLRRAGRYLDTLYHLGEYTIFAVINMQNGEWDPAIASFDSDQDFLNFMQKVKSYALYDTGIEVTAKDHIITLITCDRSYHDKSGRLLVLAVEQ